MKNTRWKIREKTENFSTDAALNVGSLAWQVMSCRGLGLDEAKTMTSKEIFLHDPMELMDMDKAVETIMQHISSQELICIYGDYDCDGVCATAMIKTYFESIGAACFYYIPNREKEGYGLNKTAIDDIYRLGAALIITVDNGVSAIDEIDYANELGMEVVVTDHHTPRESLPNAAAVVNPHRIDCKYPFKDLCGAGVAFKLLCALEGETGYELLEQYSDLLAIATVADVVALKDENRCFVLSGLEALKDSFRPGITALMELAGIKKEEITGESIAFGLSPRINAAGRLDSADLAAMLLLSEDDGEAHELAQQLNELNIERRELEKQIVNDVGQKLEENPLLGCRRMLFFSNKGWNPGVVGIVCSKLCERFGKPAILAGIGEDGRAKGSGRSVEGFSLIDAVTACSQKLTHFGGHPMAAGFSLNSADIGTFMNQLEEYAKDNIGNASNLLHVDGIINADDITVEQVLGLSVMEPFGTGNEQPVFAIMGATVTKISGLKDNKHLKLEVEAGGKKLAVMCFFTSQEQMGLLVGDKADFAVMLSINEYMGSKNVTVKCVGARLSGVDYEDLSLRHREYESLLRGEPQEEIIAPTRDDIGLIYRFMKTNSGAFGDEADIYCHIKNSCKMNYMTFRIGMDVLYEFKLVNKILGIITVLPNPQKVDITNSKIIRSLVSKV